jgi:pimeloyl-ACP methyl ester carboxylesterase
MGPIGRDLGRDFHVLEPFQRRSGGKPLTVARHVADLHEFLTARGLSRPALVGHSWGAMLALTYAVAYPEAAGPLVLIGCGTFDEASRATLSETVDRRLDDVLRGRLVALRENGGDPDERLRATGNLLVPVYSYRPVTLEIPDLERCDARGHEETWSDMLRLQAEGYYPQALAAIESPVLMLHGAADPHPGAMIRACLEPHLPGLVYREWEACGHYPWLESAVRREFHRTLREWLSSPEASIEVRSAG